MGGLGARFPLMTDVAFGLAGESVPAEHAEALARAVFAWLPWLFEDAHCGIHPLRTSGTDRGNALLSRRARLVLRVPHARVRDALALAGRTLALAPTRLAVGSGTVRPLRVSPTLYAQQVVTDAPDETVFEAQIGAALRARGIACGVLAGRAAHRQADGRDLAGFSLLLHGLADDDSLALQCTGLGEARVLGCGIFVPHKGVAAVS